MQKIRSKILLGFLLIVPTIVIFSYIQFYYTIQLGQLAVNYNGTDPVILRQNIDDVTKLLSNVRIIRDTAIIAEIIIIGLVVSRSIAKPIENLTNLCRNIDPKNLQPILGTSKNEIGEVVSAINVMIERIAQNETEIKSQNEHLQSQNRRIQKLAYVGELAARVSHNLRNPLSVITGTIGIIMQTNKNLDEATKSRLERIDAASSNMKAQIDGVLTFVKEKPLDVENNSLQQILYASISNVQKPDSVSILLPEDDVSFRCDDNKLQVVFMNLLDNAIHAIGENGEIKIRADVHNRDLIIDVEDSGPGIPDDVLPRIFDSLFTTKESGTGLGLSHCKNIVEQHGGKISVKTKPTVFTIYLPNVIHEN